MHDNITQLFSQIRVCQFKKISKREQLCLRIGFGRVHYPVGENNKTKNIGWINMLVTKTKHSMCHFFHREALWTAVNKYF